MTEPTTLYHYTSLEAVINIITTLTLRASSILYLNDSTEFEYGMSILRDTIGVSQAEATQRFGKAIARVELTDSPKRNAKKVDPFVISFSTNGDLLSQWRAYCRPGQGVSLGFSRDQIAAIAAQVGLELWPCTYDPEEHKRKASAIWQEWLNRFRTTNDRDSEDVVATEFMSAFSSLAATFKDESFQEEAEWRLVGLTGKISVPTRYRQGQSFIVPFVEVPLRVSGQRLRLNVIVGPSPHNKLSRRSLLHLFQSHNIAWRSIGPSKTPYRAW